MPTTLEKLFLQIFERKDRIIEQVQQQADSYSQQLASKLLIDGITPPQWLLSPSSSNHNELEKEDIISKLLLQPRRDSVPYPRGDCSLYYRPVIAGDNGQLSNEISMETNGPNKVINVTNDLISTIERANNDIGCSLNRVVEQDDNINSPQNETDAIISSIYSAPDRSVARIQRSKSRQKARELRTNAKTAAKSCLSNENRTNISFSGDLISKNDFHQVTQDKCPSEVGKCNDINGTNPIAAEGKIDKENENPSFVDHQSKSSSFSDKKESDDILVQQTASALIQSDHINGVMKEGKVSEVFLGSYASNKSIAEKTQDTQMQNKPFCGRITRSKSSSQQFSGKNKSSKEDERITRSKSSSQQISGKNKSSKEDECAVSQSVGDLMNGFNAVETSQVVSDRIEGKKAICSNELKEAQLGSNHQENAEIVVEDGPVNGPVAMQLVDSGIKLDPVALCKESEILTSKKSPGCCMVVEPKQLNFDEIDESDLNEICSPLSKKRKLDGLCASSIDHFEQQLSNDNIFSSSPKAAKTHSVNIKERSKDEIININLEKNDNLVLEDVEPKSRVSIHENIDITCEVNTSPKEVDNNILEENNSEKTHLNEDHASLSKMQIEEDDLDHKGEESAAGVYTKSPFISSLTKESNDDSVDLGSSKSNENEVEIEIETDPKLSNMKLNSAKFNTFPLNQQKNVEDQPYCVSDSQNFRVHIQRDVIPCDFETVENNLDSVKESASILTSEQIHVSQSDCIQSPDNKVHDEMMCDLPNETESLHELQIAEATVTEMNDDTTETVNTVEPNSGLNLVKKVTDDVGPTSATRIDDVAVTDNENFDTSLPECIYSQNDDISMTVADEIMPVYEDFNIDEEMGTDEVGPTSATRIDDVAVTDTKNFETSLPECISSQNDDISMTVADEIMPVYEGFTIDEEMGNTSMENGVDFDTLEIPSTTIARASILEQICKSASMQQTPLSQFSSAFKDHEVKNLYEFMADGIYEHTDLGNLEEDSRKHLQTSESEITEIDPVFQNQQKFKFDYTPFYLQPKTHYSSPVGKYWERSASSSGSSEKQLSSNPELTCFPIEEDPNSNEESENADDLNDEIKENENDEVAIEKETEICFQQANPVSTFMNYRDRCSSNSVNTEFSVPKTRDRVKYKPKIHPGIRISRFEENKNNHRGSSIVTRASSRGNFSEISKNKSVMRSGISQKEVKCNNIVSNISSFVSIVQQKQAAAVAPVKRDVKVKALEAAEAARRREQEKENERKMKKEALKLERARIEKENAKEMELNKRKKQEELKKKEADMAARKRQREEDDKQQKANKRKLVAEAQKNQKIQFEKSRVRKMESEQPQGKNAGNKKGSESVRINKYANENSFQKHEAELKTQVVSAPKNQKANENSPVKVGPSKLTSQENSYDISPYQTDGEDDEEDELGTEVTTKKFIPSWASPSRVAMVQPLQLKVNPERIFPIESFCDMDEVLLPRRLYAP